MRHPFQQLPDRWRQRLFATSTAATLGCAASLTVVDQPLRTEAAPWGILSFEVAASVDAAATILASWDHTAREYASLSLGLDYLFMGLYPLALSLAVALGVRPLERVAARLGRAASITCWLVLAAAAFDAIENVALWQTLRHNTDPWPQLAAACALPKFALLALGVLVAAAGGVAALTTRRASGE